MSTSTESLIQEFDGLLGKSPYVTARQLIELGVFGSNSGAAKALKDGLLPAIKVSHNRTIIPRSAVVTYFKNNLKEGASKE